MMSPRIVRKARHVKGIKIVASSVDWANLKDVLSRKQLNKADLTTNCSLDFTTVTATTSRNMEKMYRSGRPLSMLGAPSSHLHQKIIEQ